jgi:hypothetical protein
VRYKVDDIVKVVTADEDCRDAVGLVGRIVDVDEEWAFPYEIDFGIKTKQELFTEDQLVLIDPNSIVTEIDKAIQEQESIEAEIRRLVERIKEELPSSRAVSMAITKLDEARLWVGEARNG